MTSTSVDLSLLTPVSQPTELFMTGNGFPPSSFLLNRETNQQACLQKPSRDRILLASCNLCLMPAKLGTRICFFQNLNE